jgi:hypothetical protein
LLRLLTERSEDTSLRVSLCISPAGKGDGTVAMDAPRETDVAAVKGGRAATGDVVRMNAPASRPVLQRELLATEASMGVARNVVVGELRRAGLEGAVADARLITDELVMNAINASPVVATFRVDLTWWPHGLVLSVWDCCSERMPWHRPSLGRDLPDAQPDANALDPGHVCLDVGGWGLQLAEALSQRLWSAPTTAPQGKWVCALLRTHPAALNPDL